VNAHTLSQHYAQLTREERLRLTLAAVARGDQAEAVALLQSCPKMKVIAPDPDFFRLLNMVVTASSSEILTWVHLSHYVIRNYLVATVLEADDDHVLARKAEAGWRLSSAAWKGIESAIIRFCGETDLTREQVLTSEPPPLIEEARQHLHPRSRASREVATAVLHRLRQAWAGKTSPLGDGGPL
jgi:hypothetical protein